MKNIYIVLVLFLGMTLIACLDEASLDIPKSASDGLALQGQIIKVNDKVTVNVSVRFLTNPGGISEISRLATLFIENETGQKLELPFIGAAHRISFDLPNPNFDVKEGMKFKISGTSFDGKKYESDLVEMKPSPKIDRVLYEISDGQLNIKIDTKLKDEEGNKSIIKWDIENNYKYRDQLLGFPPNKLCYVTSKADLLNVKMYDGRQASFEEIKNFTVYDRQVDYFLAEGYYCTVVQQALDEKTFNYFSQINDLNQRKGSIYEPPAGQITTNLKETTSSAKVFGYFYAAVQDTMRIYVSPDAAGNPSRQCPLPPNENSICPVRSCCDCLILKGSSLDKPHFWVN
jgi:hypothetical protein